MRHLEHPLTPASSFRRKLATEVQSQGSVTRPEVNQEPLALPASPPQQPVPQRGVETHEAPVPSEHEDICDCLMLVFELPPCQLWSDVQGRVGGVQLLQADWLETGQTDGQQVTHRDE